MNVIIRLLISFLFVFIGISLSIDCTNFELKLYEVSLTSFFFSGILARVIISLYFVVAIFITLHKPNKIISYLSFCLIGLWFYLAIFDYITEEIIRLDSPLLFSKFITFIALFLAFVGVLFYYKKQGENKQSHIAIKVTKYLLSIGGIVFVFVTNPLFLEEFQDITEDSFSNNKEIYQKLSQSDPNEFAAFFSTACPYCELASKRLMLMKKRNNNFPSLKVYFIGTQEGVDWFFEETNTKLNYQILEQEDFLKITNGSYPKFIKFESSEPKSYYSGRTFNYAAPGLLSSKQ